MQSGVLLRLWKEAYRKDPPHGIVSFLCLIRFLPLPLLTVQFSDMQGRQTIQEFLGGQSGMYAMDCARAASRTNPHQLFADYMDNGKLSGMVIGMRLTPQDDSYTSGYIDQAELLNGKELLSYYVETLAGRYFFVWKREEKEAIRLFQFEDATKQLHFVNDGFIPYTTIATPVYHHCLLSMLAPGQER
jgi:hypothetical protein